MSPHTCGSFFLFVMLQFTHFFYPQVSLVLSALQAGNKGTQACITAATAVSGIIADLDTTIMFATAGTLNAENSETFADHRYVVSWTERSGLVYPMTLKVDFGAIARSQRCNSRHSNSGLTPGCSCLGKARPCDFTGLTQATGGTPSTTATR